MATATNRFNALLNDDDVEVDRLGNIKPKEKSDDNKKAPTRKEVRKSASNRLAVSPPSRRDRGPRKNEATEDVSAPSASGNERRGPRPERGGRMEYNNRGRQFDRHSGTGIVDNDKKIRQGWGEAGTAEFQGAQDSLDPNDPDAPDGRPKRDEEAEDSTKTLDEYLAEKKSSQTFRLEQGRKPNEGSNDDEWKSAVPLQKEEDNYFVGSKETETKLRNKAKKEKVHLEIDQPAYRGNNDRGGRGGRGGRGRGSGRGNRNSNGRNNSQNSVNLSDANAFPTLSTK